MQDQISGKEPQMTRIMLRIAYFSLAQRFTPQIDKKEVWSSIQELPQRTQTIFCGDLGVFSADLAWNSSFFQHSIFLILPTFHPSSFNVHPSFSAIRNVWWACRIPTGRDELVEPSAIFSPLLALRFFAYSLSHLALFLFYFLLLTFYFLLSTCCSSFIVQRSSFLLRNPKRVVSLPNHLWWALSWAKACPARPRVWAEPLLIHHSPWSPDTPLASASLSSFGPQSVSCSRWWRPPNFGLRI